MQVEDPRVVKKPKKRFGLCKWERESEAACERTNWASWRNKYLSPCWTQLETTHATRGERN